MFITDQLEMIAMQSDNHATIEHCVNTEVDCNANCCCLFSVNVQNCQEESFMSDLEEGSIESVSSSGDDFDLPTVDMQTDMLERFSTAERARNTDLFEQLRAWQAEQRQQLIQQQKQQLLELQTQQQAAESRLLLQRQNMWNSSKNTTSSVAAKNLPHNSSLRKTQIGLPQAIASSTLALARLRLQESVMVSSDIGSPTPMPLSSAVGVEQVDVHEEGDLETVAKDGHPPSGRVSITAHQPQLSDDIDLTDNTQSLPPCNRDVTHKPEAGMSVYEYDELPVAAGAGQGKSFEQLVLEQLEKEQQQPAQCTFQESKSNKWFLRKGEGTARFRTYQREFRRHKAIEDPRNLKQSTAFENRSSGSAPAAESVVQPICRKLCLKEKTQPTGDSVPQLGYITDNVKCVGTPVTSTPSRKQFQPSADNVAFHHMAADKSSQDRDFAGDASYLACMQARAQKEEVEDGELQEFELLEHFVDDSASFTSNMSSISQILAHHDVKRPAKCGEVPRVNYNGVNHEVSVTACHQQMEEVCSDEDSSDHSDDADEDDDNFNSTLVDDTSVIRVAATTLPGNAVQPTALQSAYRKISSMNCKRLFTESQSVLVDAVDEQMLSSNGDAAEHSVIPTADQPTHDLSQRHDRMGHDAFQEPPKHIRDADTLDHARAACDNVFSDERMWNDSINIISSPLHGDNDLNCNPPENTSSSNCVASTSSSEAQLSTETGYYTADAQTDSPPTSRLAQKLFPKLKPQKSASAELRNSVQTAVSSSHAADCAPVVTSSAVREKLAQLEIEIQQFRNENAVLATLRKEREQVVDRLKREMAEFERQKADELQRLENFKAEEMKKLKKERRVFETYQKAARSGPDRKDREEIETLKSQLNELQEETKRKEQKWIASNQRLRNRVEQLEQENTELRDEIRVLQQRRLQDWKPRRNEPVPAKLTDLPLYGQNSELGTADKKFHKQTEPQQDIPNTRHQQPEQISKSSPGSSAINSSSRTQLNLDVSDEMLQQRNIVPKLQTSISASTGVGGNGVSSLSAIRKTAAKSGVVDSVVDISDRSCDQVLHVDGKVERLSPDGSREILFTNGTRKQISSDGQTVIVSFFNGDIKQMLPDGRVVYYYADAQTTHTTYADGLQIFQFVSGQVEKHYVNGTKEIQFSDQTIKYLFPDGSAESVFLDGTIVRAESNGNKQITFPNGQKEVHTALFKKREYPDGTTKTVFTDGRQETRYSNGRVRVKDASGVVVVDQLS